jgi:hypothetical protein
MPENDEMSLDEASRKFLLSLNNPFRIIDAVSFVNPFLLDDYIFDSASPIPFLFGTCIASAEVPPENLVQDILG